MIAYHRRTGILAFTALSLLTCLGGALLSQDGGGTRELDRVMESDQALVQEARNLIETGEFESAQARLQGVSEDGLLATAAERLSQLCSAEMEVAHLFDGVEDLVERGEFEKANENLRAVMTALDRFSDISQTHNQATTKLIFVHACETASELLLSALASDNPSNRLRELTFIAARYPETPAGRQATDELASTFDTVLSEVDHLRSEGNSLGALKRVGEFLESARNPALRARLTELKDELIDELEEYRSSLMGEIRAASSAYGETLADCMQEEENGELTHRMSIIRQFLRGEPVDFQGDDAGVLPILPNLFRQLASRKRFVVIFRIIESLKVNYSGRPDETALLEEIEAEYMDLYRDEILDGDLPLLEPEPIIWTPDYSNPTIFSERELVMDLGELGTASQIRTDGLTFTTCQFTCKFMLWNYNYLTFGFKMSDTGRSVDVAIQHAQTTVDGEVHKYCQVFGQVYASATGSPKPYLDSNSRPTNQLQLSNMEDGQWHTLEVRIREGSILIKVDGNEVINDDEDDIEEVSLRPGKLMLELYRRDSGSRSFARFKDIRFRGEGN